MKLITYRCESRGRIIWGQDVAENPVEWLEECQQYETEIYLIVSCIDITDEESKRIAGCLRGM